MSEREKEKNSVVREIKRQKRRNVYKIKRETSKKREKKSK